MERLVRAFRPTIVLQHPHSTDSSRIWRMPWKCLEKDHRSVRAWASGISHHNWGRRTRQTLRETLEGTRSSDEIYDIIVDVR